MTAEADAASVLAALARAWATLATSWFDAGMTLLRDLAEGAYDEPRLVRANQEVVLIRSNRTVQLAPGAFRRKSFTVPADRVQLARADAAPDAASDPVVVRANTPTRVVVSINPTPTTPVGDYRGDVRDTAGAVIEPIVIVHISHGAPRGAG